MSEDNKAVSRRFFEAWTEGRLDEFDRILAPGYVDHDTQNPNAGTPGPEGPRQTAQMYRTAFPDSRFAIEQQLADGDYVVTRWTATGTHEGDLMGMPASGRSVEVTGISIDRFENGVIVEGWTNWDTIGMMQQLGAIPQPQEAGA